MAAAGSSQYVRLVSVRTRTVTLVAKTGSLSPSSSSSSSSSCLIRPLSTPHYSGACTPQRLFKVQLGKRSQAQFGGEEGERGVYVRACAVHEWEWGMGTAIE